MQYFKDSYLCSIKVNYLDFFRGFVGVVGETCSGFQNFLYGLQG